MKINGGVYVNAVEGLDYLSIKQKVPCFINLFAFYIKQVSCRMFTKTRVF